MRFDGQFLRRLREARGWKLRDLERRTGLSNAYLSQLETGGHVWVTPPKCERCGDSGMRPAEMGCFGVKRWERCHCDAGDGRDSRWPGILKRLAEAVSVAEEKSKPTQIKSARGNKRSRRGRP